MRSTCLLFVLAALFCLSETQRKLPPNAPISEKYNLQRLPWDTRPVWFMVGVWQAFSPAGSNIPNDRVVALDTLDFGIGILPMFGSRSLNYSGYVHDFDGNVVLSEYGYMIVKNATRRDPSVQTAFLTVGDEGYTTLEEGEVKGNEITYTNNAYSRRGLHGSFREGHTERTFTFNNDVLTQNIVFKDHNGFEKRRDRTQYRKVGGWNCRQGCDHMERWLSLFNACSLCNNAG